MEWNQHRLAYLSGIEGLNATRSKLLKENRAGRSRKSNHPRPGSLEALNEARLRSALRKEILSVLREELAAKDDKQVKNGLSKMSLSTSMGFGGCSEPKSGLMSRLVGENHVPKGMQTVTLTDVTRHRI